jgi:hypothetical protein
LWIEKVEEEGEEVGKKEKKKKKETVMEMLASPPSQIMTGELLDIIGLTL